MDVFTLPNASMQKVIENLPDNIADQGEEKVVELYQDAMGQMELSDEVSERIKKKIQK